MTPQSDKELIHIFCTTRSEDAFACLAARYQGLILAAAYRIAQDQGVAEDVLQHCLTYMAEHPETLIKVEHLGAWLHTIATREVMRITKASHKRRQREAIALQSSDTSENSTAALLDTLDEALEKLRPTDRQVVIQHHLKGLSFKEIALQNGGTHSQWQKKCRRALKKLVSILDQRGIKSSSAALSAILIAPSVQPTLLSTETLHILARQTLANTTPTTVAATLPFLTTLLTMKIGITLSCLCGILCSDGLSHISAHAPIETPQKPPPPQKPKIHDHYREVPPPNYQNSRAHAKVNLKTITSLINEIDGEENPHSQRFSELRALVFLLPEDLLPQAFEHFTQTHHKYRFKTSVTALFGRWAEFDPEAALEASRSHEYFENSARRGSMVTWLAIDFPAAAQRLASDKNSKDISIIQDYVHRRGRTHPVEVALEIDQLAELWEEADEPIFRYHAKLWARSDPEGASDWVSSYHNTRIANDMLGDMAVKVGRSRGFEGLDIIKKITDPEKASKAKNDTILWWGVYSGGHSLSPKAPTHRNLSSGFPNDWSMRNIQTFADAYMENWSHAPSRLLDITSTPEQVAAVTRGVISGAGHSDPEAALPFIQTLPPEALSHLETQQALTRFLTVWKQSHPAKAQSWMEQQTEPALTTLINQLK